MVNAAGGVGWVQRCGLGRDAARHSCVKRHQGQLPALSHQAPMASRRMDSHSLAMRAVK